MGFFQKAKAWLLDDHCTGCAVPMDTVKKQLYMLPNLIVGHYVAYDDPHFYESHMVQVNKKADIPTGFYACYAYVYQCPKCHKQVVKLKIFLPVRDQEQLEDTYLYEEPSLIKFVLES